MKISMYFSYGYPSLGLIVPYKPDTFNTHFINLDNTDHQEVPLESR